MGINKGTKNEKEQIEIQGSITATNAPSPIKP
jgi:hypothetical protein